MTICLTSVGMYTQGGVKDGGTSEDKEDRMSKHLNLAW